MKCPLLSAGTTQRQGDECMRENCAWWEEHFGKCAIAVEAYLKGVADHRLEIKESQRDRY